MVETANQGAADRHAVAVVEFIEDAMSSTLL